MSVPIIGQPKVVELRVKVTEDVATRIMTDRQRLEAMVHGQAAIIAGLVDKFGEGGKVDLNPEENGIGVSLARKVGASYHPDGSVTVALIGYGHLSELDPPADAAPEPEEHESPSDAAGSVVAP